MTLPYIINVAVVLGACLAFYKVLLRRETFYRFNRFWFIVCLALSFTLPLAKVPKQFSLRRESSVVSRESSIVSRESSVVNRESRVHNKQQETSNQQPPQGNDKPQTINDKQSNGFS